MMIRCPLRQCWRSLRRRRGWPSGCAISIARRITWTGCRSRPRNRHAPRVSAPTCLRRRWIAGRTMLRSLLGQLARDSIPPGSIAARRSRTASARRRVDGRFQRLAYGRHCAHRDRHRHPGRNAYRYRHRARGPPRQRDGLARKFLTRRERAEIAPLTSDIRRKRFLRLWTCKEAMSKATGDALSAPFRYIDVTLDGRPAPGGRPRSLQSRSVATHLRRHAGRLASRPWPSGGSEQP